MAGGEAGVPGFPLRLHSGHHPARRPTPRETKTGGEPTALVRLRGDGARRGSQNSPPPAPAWPDPRRSRHAQRSRPITSKKPLEGSPGSSVRSRAAPACHLQSGPAPATPEPLARASTSAVPWSRASATSHPSRGNHCPHRRAARPSTIPAARGVRAAPPSSCGLGRPSAEGTGAGPCLRTSRKEGRDARAAQPAR